MALLAGCIYIPAKEEPPPFDETAQVIKTGETTRKEILFTLGVPAIARRDGKLFFYSEGQTLGFLLWALPGGGGVVEIGIGHSLSIEFNDDNTVRQIVQMDRCMPTGECFYPLSSGWTTFATPEEDSQAKTFTPVADRCTVYFYTDIQYHKIQAFLDSRLMGGARWGHYFRWRLEPGRYELRTWTPYSDASRRELSIDCAPGQLLYVRYDEGLFLSFDLDVVGDEEGREGVRRGHLILDDF